MGTMKSHEKFNAEAELAKLNGEKVTYAIVERFDDNGENRGVFFIEITDQVRPHLNEVVSSFTRDFLEDEGRFLTLALLPKDALSKFTTNEYTSEITFEWKGEEDMTSMKVKFYRFGNPSLFFK